MATKLYEAVKNFETVVQKIDRVFSAIQRDIQDPENKLYLQELLTQMRNGWAVLGSQILMYPHCPHCGGVGVIKNEGQEVVCSVCSVRTSVEEQLEDLKRRLPPGAPSP